MIYEQSAGKLWDAAGGILLANCYSGFGVGKNNPDLQDKVGLGPIPTGWYTIDDQVENVNVAGPHGKYVLRLHPDPGNEMHGRGGFLIHGDSIHTPGTASHGCIVTGRKEREEIWALGDRRLQVVRSVNAVRRLSS
jgi:hypothetical protein